MDSVISYFRKKNDPAVIVLPTGAGKSLVIAEMARIAKVEFSFGYSKRAG